MTEQRPPEYPTLQHYQPFKVLYHLHRFTVRPFCPFGTFPHTVGNHPIGRMQFL